MASHATNMRMQAIAKAGQWVWPTADRCNEVQPVLEC